MADAVSCVDFGDTAWVLICFLLVLTMMPALALFEAGMLRSKNTLSIITQIVIGIVINSVLWYVIGYSLTYGETWGGMIGSPRNAFLIGVSFTECSRHAPNIPRAAFAMFQMMFAAITPLLLTGAYAERLAFKASLVLTVAFEVLVYYPLAHWIFAYDGWLNKMGVEDFAGGIVIHTSSGIAALICAAFLGQRHEFDKYEGEFPPSNLALAAIGTALLWAGWFGFNAGSALAANRVAVAAVTNTQIACSVSALAWLMLQWRHTGKPSSVAAINGTIAGLAGITPACGYINPHMALILGLVLGIVSFFSAHFFKGKLRLDDALDVSSVHGVTGLVGSLSIGILGSKDVNPDGVDGLAYGGGFRLLGIQVLGIVVTLVYSGFVTVVILWAMYRWMEVVRVDFDDEERGLDLAEFGETAYHDLHLTMEEMEHTLPKHFASSYRRLLNSRPNSAGASPLGMSRFRSPPPPSVDSIKFRSVASYGTLSPNSVVHVVQETGHDDDM